jgi:hypothetical protein
LNIFSIIFIMSISPDIIARDMSKAIGGIGVGRRFEGKEVNGNNNRSVQPKHKIKKKPHALISMNR